MEVTNRADYELICIDAANMKRVKLMQYRDLLLTVSWCDPNAPFDR